MSEDNNDRKVQLLTGQSNYHGWKKVVMALLKQKACYENDAFVEAKNTESVNLIVKYLSLNIAGDIPDDAGPLVMWDWLQNCYGDDNKWDLERDFKGLTMV